MYDTSAFRGAKGVSWVDKFGNRIYGSIDRINQKTISVKVVKTGHDSSRFMIGSRWRIAIPLCKPEETLPEVAVADAPQSTYPVGLTVKEVRWAKATDLWKIGLDPDSQINPPQVLVMSDGSIIVPSQDPEGNGPGFLFTTGDESGYVQPRNQLEKVNV
jgi:hypothetical protein